MPLPKNPCPCGCSLRTGTQIVAILNIVLDSILAVLLILGIIGYFAIDPQQFQSDTDSQSESWVSGSNRTTETVSDSGTSDVYVLIVGLVSLLVCVFHLITSIVLLLGANQRHYGKRRFWFIVTSAFLVVFLVYSASLFRGKRAKIDVFSSVWRFFYALITAYQIWVVYAFAEEVKEANRPVVTSAGFVQGPGDGVPPQAYVYTQPGFGQAPPQYDQNLVGYTPVPLNGPPGGSNYPPSAYPTQGPGYPANPPHQGFYPSLPIEKP